MGYKVSQERIDRKEGRAAGRQLRHTEAKKMMVALEGEIHLTLSYQGPR